LRLRFLLGLTATPDRTDQSDILSLCDDNLVYSCHLFAGIQAGLLAPFHYHGIQDESVDYREVPWRNGRFDPSSCPTSWPRWPAPAMPCANGAARRSSARWRSASRRAMPSTWPASSPAPACRRRRGVRGLHAGRAQRLSNCTPARCGGVLGRPVQRRRRPAQHRHGDDAAADRVEDPVSAATRPRPAQSEGKQHWWCWTSSATTTAFCRSRRRCSVWATFRELAASRARRAATLDLPKGCYVNYDLAIIDFLKSLDSNGVAQGYEALRDVQGRRPSLSEFYRCRQQRQAMRQQAGQLVPAGAEMGDLTERKTRCLARIRRCCARSRSTAMTKSFKMVLLEALLELDGWRKPKTLAVIAEQSWRVLQRRRPLLADLPDSLDKVIVGNEAEWIAYWTRNPINAWIGGNLKAAASSFFSLSDDRFLPEFSVSPENYEAFESMLQELLDYRLAAYEVRRIATQTPNNVIPLATRTSQRTDLSFFPNLKIACGHFRTGSTDAAEYRSLGAGYRQLDPARHFIARAAGSSMDGGKNPIRDGDYLLFELMSPTRAGSITGQVIAIEQQDEAGDDQYLLRVVSKTPAGDYLLKANNPAYPDLLASESMHTRARFKAILDPLEFAVGQSFKREEIPALFGQVFNPGNWHAGHVVLNDGKVHVLLVTIRKQGKASDQRYVDHWIDAGTFHWQSQNQTGPTDRRGLSLIEHKRHGVAIHLFVRETKLAAGKSAPFLYCGPANYLKHSGSKPMSVIFDVPEMA
jgi:hypothetical protein